MTWVTSRHITMNRVATAWPMRRDGVKGFDAPGATYPHQGPAGRCSFEALVDEHCADDATLVALGRIRRGADFRDQIDLTPESPGLRAISDGFPVVARDDQETVQKAAFLYATLQAPIAGS